MLEHQLTTSDNKPSEKVYHLLNQEAGANLAISVTIKKSTDYTGHEESNKSPEPLEKALAMLVKDQPSQFIPLFINLLDHEDEKIRRAAIETLSQFSHFLGTKTSTIPEIIDRRIHHCRDSGRFKELYHLVNLWQTLTGNAHELTHFATEIFAYIVNKNIEDNETATYISIAKAVAKINGLEILSSQVKIFLLSDGDFQWINYCIELPEEAYDVDKIFEMNSQLVAKTLEQDISLKMKKLMIIMFK
ncbi:hypothetical protein BGP_1509 [Beggiatoa sp. PS]|nr:hypothetical protein BGP_1509 [Beggiatoa sp. PS]